MVRALAGDIVLCSWARHFTLTVPLSTQVYKWVPAVPPGHVPCKFLLERSPIGTGIKADKQSTKWRLEVKIESVLSQATSPMAIGLATVVLKKNFKPSSHFMSALSYQYLKIVTRNIISTTSYITHDHLWRWVVRCLRIRQLAWRSFGDRQVSWQIR